MSRSRASRDRELQRALRREPGRPPGSRKSLLDTPRRFMIAVQLAVSGLKLLGPYDQAALIAVIVRESGPIEIERLRNCLVVLSAHYPHPAMTSFGAAIDRLVRDSRPPAFKRFTGEEANWLAQSAGAIQGVLIFMAAEDYLGVRASLDLLDRAGWRETIASIRERVERAVRTNIPPFEETGLGRRGRKLLDLLDEHVGSSGMPEADARSASIIKSF
jgi:hypothetical protein